MFFKISSYFMFAIVCALILWTLNQGLMFNSWVLFLIVSKLFLDDVIWAAFHAY